MASLVTTSDGRERLDKHHRSIRGDYEDGFGSEGQPVFMRERRGKDRLFKKLFDLLLHITSLCIKLIAQLQ